MNPTQTAFPPVLPQVTLSMVEYQMRGLNAVRRLGCMIIPVFKSKTHSGQWERHRGLNSMESEIISCCCVRLFVTPWTIDRQAPLSMEFSRQEYWSGLPFPSPGVLPEPGFKPRSPVFQADPLPSESLVCMHAKLLQSFPTLWDQTMPGFSVHRVLQARILEWIALLSSRGSSRLRDRNCVSYISCIGRWILYH